MATKKSDAKNKDVAFQASHIDQLVFCFHNSTNLFETAVFRKARKPVLVHSVLWGSASLSKNHESHPLKTWQPTVFRLKHVMAQSLHLRLRLHEPFTNLRFGICVHRFLTRNNEIRFLHNHNDMIQILYQKREEVVVELQSSNMPFC